MPKVKTRKTVDAKANLNKAITAEDKMKKAFLRSKDAIQNLSDDGKVSPSEYAEDKMQYATEDATRDVTRFTVNQGKKLAHKGREILRERRAEEKSSGDERTPETHHDSPLSTEQRTVVQTNDETPLEVASPTYRERPAYPRRQPTASENMAQTSTTSEKPLHETRVDHNPALQHQSVRMKEKIAETKKSSVTESRVQKPVSKHESVVKENGKTPEMVNPAQGHFQTGTSRKASQSEMLIESPQPHNQHILPDKRFDSHEPKVGRDRRQPKTLNRTIGRQESIIEPDVSFSNTPLDRGRELAKSKAKTRQSELRAESRKERTVGKEDISLPSSNNHNISEGELNHAITRTRHGQKAPPAQKAAPESAQSQQARLNRPFRQKVKTIKNTSRELRETSKKAIKTAEQTSRTTVKTAKVAAKTTQKTAQASARAARASAQAAKAAARAAVITAKAVGKAIVAAAKAIAAATKELIAAIAAGGWVVVVAVIVICLIGLVVASPFGIFFATGNRETGAITAASAVAQVNYDFNTVLESLQDGEYDGIDISGSMADWPEVIAVFAVKVAGSNDVDATDVATLDPSRVAKLKAVFWDMNSVTAEVETIDYPDSDPDDEVDDSWSESYLHITISSKTAAEMVTEYHFTEKQKEMLNELLSDRAALLELIGNLEFINADAAELIRNLPDDLSQERRSVIKAACSLVGKVNYFWGGKSLVIGWDSRWGSIQQVWAAGSPTTGTYRPYGLDCSGFVDWTFYNASDGTYVLGHGGGTYSQHAYSTDISWDQAMPGDIVFTPEDTHVGIVGGRDESGNLLIIHCGDDGVVISGASFFATVCRPHYFSD